VILVLFANSIKDKNFFNVNNYIKCETDWICIEQNIFISKENTPYIIDDLKLHKQIILRDDFNQPLDNLPDEITHITMYYKCIFNHPMNNLPHSLKCLHILAESFFQPLDNLPFRLVELFIGNMNYNLPLDNLPNVLKTLKFIRLSKYKQPLRNLPPSIENIILYKYYPFSNEIKKLYPNTNIIIIEW
jgi:hypothetical protein